MGCLYRLSFPSGKAYIGITSLTAVERFKEHRYDSLYGRKERAVNRAIRKYGVENVGLETLVIAEWDYLLDLEQRAIAGFGTFGEGGYNMTVGGEGVRGYKATEEVKAKLRAAHTHTPRHTTPHSAETKAQMSLDRKGKKKNLSDEQREHRRQLMLGNKHAIGVVFSEETRVKRRLSQLGATRGARSTSGVVGVSYYKKLGKWRAHGTWQGRFNDLGYFDSIEDASKARAAWAAEVIK